MNDNISKEINAKQHSFVNVPPTERLISAAVGGLLLFNGLYRKGKNANPQIVVGSLLLFRGIAGYSVVYDAAGKDRVPRVAKNINIRTNLFINKPRHEVYSFWRRLENLPLFMSHLEKVDKIDEKYSWWKAKLPGTPVAIEWKAEIVKEELNNHLGWSSIEGSTIHNAGKVEFKDAGSGTELDITITYHPPLGILGTGVAKLFNKVFEKMVKRDIKNFKIFMETGQLPDKKKNKLQP